MAFQNYGHFVTEVLSIGCGEYACLFFHVLAVGEWPCFGRRCQNGTERNSRFLPRGGVGDGNCSECWRAGRSAGLLAGQSCGPKDNRLAVRTLRVGEVVDLRGRSLSASVLTLQPAERNRELRASSSGWLRLRYSRSGLRRHSFRWPGDWPPG